MASNSNTNNEPMGAPPPYEEAPPGPPPSHQNNLQVPSPQTHSSIPPLDRRSMEDESRSLPPNWVRTYDAETHHQFFVDTSTEPPRSIWHHPYDDEQYLASLSPAERAKIQGLHNHDRDYSSGEEDYDHDHEHAQGASGAQAGADGDVKGVHKFGRKMKDKLTSSTHPEREAKRKARDEEEARMYQQHQRFRLAMSKAAQTGEPQLFGKDKQGRDVYIEPPPQFGGMGMGGGMGHRGYPGNGIGFNPYTQGGYANPNARYLRPQGPYGRPLGGGYGGGYGMQRGGMGGMGGMGMPLLGGMMLGGLMF